MLYLPCPSSSIYSKGNMLSHSTKHSFMALMIVPTFYLWPSTPILPMLHTQCRVLGDSHRSNNITNYSKNARKAGNPWKVHSSPLIQWATEAGSVTVKRSQLASKTPLRTESLWFPCLDSSYCSTQGQTQILWAWTLNNLGLLYEKQ